MSDNFEPPPPADFGTAGVASAGIPAEFGPRLIAYLTDIVLGFALFIPVFIVGLVIGVISETLCAIVSILLYLAVGLGWLYVLIMGMAVNGQTPGKRMQGIKVVQDSGEPLGVGGAIIRWFVQAISNTIICGLPLGSLSMLADGEKKTIYDKVLNNQSIQVEKGSLTPIFPDGKPF